MSGIEKSSSVFLRKGEEARSQLNFEIDIGTGVVCTSGAKVKIVL